MPLPTNTNGLRDVRLTFSIGLLAAIFAHAWMTATAQRVAPHIEQAIFKEYSPAAPTGGINFDAVRGAAPVNSLPVNSTARDEAKGAPQSCATCPQIAQPVAKPAVQNAVRPLTSTPQNVRGTSKPIKPRYSITFFVRHDEAQSRRLIQWVNSDPTLQKWKASTNFHTYAPGNELYKTRYANVIPAEYFPAVLVTAPDGGHVYLAYQGHLPNSASELVQGITTSVNLHKQVVKGAPPDSTADPNAFRFVSVSDSSSSCDDESCDPGRTPNGSNAGGLIDLLRPAPATDPVEGLIRRVLAPQVSMTAILLVIVGAVVVVIFVKRG